jgi:hypothetical protein
VDHCVPLSSPPPCHFCALDCKPFAPARLPIMHGAHEQ